LRTSSTVLLVQSDIYTLPSDLPAPENDGGAAHLPGMEIPALTLESSLGPVKLRDFELIYIYPRTGRPGRDAAPGWDQIPGARGCTPESCAFRDAVPDFERLSVRVAGLSAQTLDDQQEFAQRNQMSFPVIADPERKLGEALRLPTFEVQGQILYKRLTLVTEAGKIIKVFYPVFPPDKHAEQVLTWLSPRLR
jgi:peroxiredoxin